MKFFSAEIFILLCRGFSLIFLLWAALEAPSTSDGKHGRSESSSTIKEW